MENHTAIQPQPLTRDQWYATYMELQEVIAPYVQAQVELLSVVCPSYVVTSDGRVEPLHDGLSQGMRKVMDELRAMQREAACHLLELLERGVQPE